MTIPLPDFRDSSLTADEVRLSLGLQAHPEGGHYRELWRETAPGGGRGAASSIFFLLAEGERSHWHRVDAVEIWLWQAGAPLRLGLAHPGGGLETVKLGPDAGAGECFQGIVPANAWQEAVSLGKWTLVSCIVAPAFQFDGFELAPRDWSPLQS
jgi:predicted cupin superfamily sugar epimerase